MLTHPMSTAVMQPVTVGCRELKVVLYFSLNNKFSKAEINETSCSQTPPPPLPFCPLRQLIPSAENAAVADLLTCTSCAMHTRQEQDRSHFQPCTYTASPRRTTFRSPQHRSHRKPTTNEVQEPQVEEAGETKQCFFLAD